MHDQFQIFLGKKINVLCYTIDIKTVHVLCSSAYVTIFAQTLMNAYIPMENVTIYVSMKGDHIDVSVQMALP